MAASAAAAVSRAARAGAGAVRRALRVAHLSDIHFQRFPRARDLLHVKRLIGVANLYVGGRHRMFSLEVQRQCVAAIRALRPDVVLVSGDLTSVGTDDEFALARDELAPLLDAQPSLVIPGNHDAYIASAVRARRFEHYFGRWMGSQHPDALGVYALQHTAPDAPPLTIFGLNPCRPTLIGSTGLYPAQQLKALGVALDALAPPQPAAAGAGAAGAGPGTAAVDSAGAMAGAAGAGVGASGALPFVLLATHYPVMHYSRKPYERASPWHGVTNGAELLTALERARVAPNAIVHGHQHRGFRTYADCRGGAIPIFDAGAAGNTFSDGSGRNGHGKARRFAQFNVYHIAHADAAADAAADGGTPPPLAAAATGASLPLPPTAPRGYRLSVQRFVHDGAAFVQQNVPYKDGSGTRPAADPFTA